MSAPFLSEVKIVGFNFPPRSWAQCDGQLLPINQNQALFSLLGTIYGGDGRTTFALPELRGRAPMHFDGVNRQGSRSGEERHSLSLAEIPSHSHSMQATDNAADVTSPQGALHAVTGGGRRPVTPYAAATADTQVPMGGTANGGNGAGHENMQPSMVLNFVICIQGVFPSRN